MVNVWVAPISSLFPKVKWNLENDSVKEMYKTKHKTERRTTEVKAKAKNDSTAN
jgi:hypothetical protein